MSIEDEYRKILQKLADTNPSHPQQVYDPVDVALEELRDQLRGEMSYGDEWQLKDPRISYIEVQADKEFYAWLMGDTYA